MLLQVTVLPLAEVSNFGFEPRIPITSQDAIVEENPKGKVNLRELPEDKGFEVENWRVKEEPWFMYKVERGVIDADFI